MSKFKSSQEEPKHAQSKDLFSSVCMPLLTLIYLMSAAQVMQYETILSNKYAKSNPRLIRLSPYLIIK